MIKNYYPDTSIRVECQQPKISSTNLHEDWKHLSCFYICWVLESDWLALRRTPRSFSSLSTICLIISLKLIAKILKCTLNILTIKFKGLPWLGRMILNPLLLYLWFYCCTHTPHRRRMIWLFFLLVYSKVLSRKLAILSNISLWWRNLNPIFIVVVCFTTYEEKKKIYWVGKRVG